MPAKTASYPKREIELDLLRGIAILAVLDYHGGRLLSYPLQLLGLTGGANPFHFGETSSIRPAHLGWVGVDVFFVLSGFLVGGLLVKEWKTRGGMDTKRFLIRRGFKIWPQYYLFLILTVVTGHRSFREMWPAFVNIQNYFDRGVPHLWSLGVEEHAYLLLVGLLAFASARAMRMRQVFVMIAVLCCVVIGLRGLMLYLWLPYSTQTHTRVEAILYGVLLAILFHAAPERFHRLQERRWPWVLAMLAGFAFLIFHGNQVWTVSVVYDAANLVGVSLLMLVYRHRPDVVRSWPYRLVAWIGLYSYGIYLWHVSMNSVTLKLCGKLPRSIAGFAAVMLQPVLGIVAGMVMTKLVEFPMLRLRDRWFPRRVESAVEDSRVETAAMAER